MISGCTYTSQTSGKKGKRLAFREYVGSRAVGFCQSFTDVSWGVPDWCHENVVIWTSFKTLIVVRKFKSQKGNECSSEFVGT